MYCLTRKDVSLSNKKRCFPKLRRSSKCWHISIAAKSLQSCPTLCDPIDGYQAPPSLGFSRQEHWSGLPFPSPVHESEKWKWSRSVVYDSSLPHGLQPTRLLRPWDFPGKEYWSGVPFPSPDPRSVPSYRALWFVYDFTSHTFKRKEREVRIWNCQISE